MSSAVPSEVVRDLARSYVDDDRLLMTQLSGLIAWVGQRADEGQTARDIAASLGISSRRAVELLNLSGHWSFG